MTGHWLAGIAGIVLGLVIGAGVQQLRVQAAQNALDKTVKDYALKLGQAQQDRANALEAARAKDKVIDNQQKALNETIEANAEAGAQLAAEAQKRIAAADAQSRGLREQLAAVTARFNRARVKAGDAAGTAADLEAAHATIGVLAELYRRADDRAGAVERFADEAHAAGLACQRDYESGRAAMKEK